MDMTIYRFFWDEKEFKNKGAKFSLVAIEWALQRAIWRQEVLENKGTCSYSTFNSLPLVDILKWNYEF